MDVLPRPQVIVLHHPAVVHIVEPSHVTSLGLFLIIETIISLLDVHVVDKVDTLKLPECLNGYNH